MISSFCPGIINLKVFAWPRVILSKCLICFLVVTLSPLTKILLSWKGMINIYPFSWMIVQCFFMIPKAFNLISFSYDSFVPIFISPSFNLYINIPARVGSYEIFIKYGSLSSFGSFLSVYRPASFKAFFLFSYISAFLFLSSYNCFYKSYIADLFFDN